MITDVQRQFQYPGVYVDSVPSIQEFNLDVFGIDARLNALIQAGDYYDGPAALSSVTLIQTDVITPSTIVGNLSIGNSRLLAFVQSLYNPDGTPISAFASFRLNPNVDLPVNSGLRRGYPVARADHPDDSFRPSLSLTTAVSEPFGFFIFATGVLGLAAVARRARS